MILLYCSLLHVWSHVLWQMGLGMIFNFCFLVYYNNFHLKLALRNRVFSLPCFALWTGRELCWCILKRLCHPSMQPHCKHYEPRKGNHKEPKSFCWIMWPEYTLQVFVIFIPMVAVYFRPGLLSWNCSVQLMPFPFLFACCLDTRSRSLCVMQSFLFPGALPEHSNHWTCVVL